MHASPSPIKPSLNSRQGLIGIALSITAVAIVTLLIIYPGTQEWLTDLLQQPTTKESPSTPTPIVTVSTESLKPPRDGIATIEEEIQFTDLPKIVQTKVNQSHPTRIIREVKKESYVNGAIAYAIELIISGYQWDMGILPDGTVIRDEPEVIP
jgi:hypothetical protein